MVASYLKESGHEVLTARDKTEAMATAGKATLDLMVIDLNLAGDSGLNLMPYLIEQHPGVPVILHTGMIHDEDAINKMLNLGAYQYLRKSSLNALLKAVQDAPAPTPVQASAEN